MRQQNIIIFSSGKNKWGAHEIARGLDGEACRTVVWDEFFNKIFGNDYTLTMKKIRPLTMRSSSPAKEIDLFRNTLVQFLFKDKAGGFHATATDAATCATTIFIDEISF